MPTFQHHFPLLLLEARPDLLCELLALAGVPVPAHTRQREASPDFTIVFSKSGPTTSEKLSLLERRADGHVLLIDGDRAVMSAVVEVQRTDDAGKPGAIPVYLTVARERHHCPTLVLVICLDRAAARRLKEPIPVGPFNSVQAIVLGPDELDLPQYPYHRASPERVLLAVACSPDRIHQPEVRETVHKALEPLDTQRIRLYTDWLAALAFEVGGHPLEEIMGQEAQECYSSYFRRIYGQYEDKGHKAGHAEGRTEGVAVGLAEAVLQILHHRDLAVTNADRVRILDSDDQQELKTWLDRALTVEQVEDLFA
ncbi:hypothetical protein J4573_12730 [Actinomadura barringtoniae]|uniref:Uncharacterized protein n=1 Tax=Actinomadura barringtoniae TaxID=1427535 RepID=A0A939PGA8_9ACTN|nr:hypothetical protein [Actinomadura barringtoniae]MBO2447961.1 hypothetical protein [Actinomadura barringtoniae]